MNDLSIVLKSPINFHLLVTNLHQWDHQHLVVTGLVVFFKKASHQSSVLFCYVILWITIKYCSNSWHLRIGPPVKEGVVCYASNVDKITAGVTQKPLMCIILFLRICILNRELRSKVKNTSYANKLNIKQVDILISKN